MAYTAKINGQTFFRTDVHDSRFMLTDIELNLPYSIKFTVPKTNKFYGQFRKFKSKIDVYHNGKNIFTGRVLCPAGEMNGNITYICEYANAFFHDAMLRPYTYEHMTNHEVFRAMVEEYNAQVEEDIQIAIGRITVPTASCYRDFENLEFINTRLNTLSENFESRYVVRKTDSGYEVDWLSSYDRGCNQKIELASNVLDITWADQQTEVYTRLIAKGAEDENGNQIDLTSVTEGNVDYVQAEKHWIDEYGLKTGTKTWEDVTIPSHLKAKADAWVEANCIPIRSIVVTSVDLADTGMNVDSFEVGQRVYVSLPAYDIEGYFDVVEMTIYPLNPEANTLTLGNTVLGYIEEETRQSNKQQEAVEKLYRRTQKNKTTLEKEIDRVTKEITGNLGGNLIIHDSDGDGAPDELLIMDTADIKTAQNVWRFNKNGLAHSSTGYVGEYILAATSDGAIVADRITVGYLNAALIKAGILQSENGGTYWNLETGEFHLEGDVEYDASKIYVHQPRPPYTIGDLWIKDYTETAIVGEAVAGEAIVKRVPKAYMCVNTKTAGEYDEHDWTFVFEYYDDSTVKNLENRISRAELTVDQQAAQIRSKVSIIDLDGEFIASEINQAPDGVMINAKHLNIKGEGIITEPYTEDDAERCWNIINGTITPTRADIDRLDLDGNGRINTLDYIKIRNLASGEQQYKSNIDIDQNVVKKTIHIYDNLENDTYISAMAVSTPTVRTEKLVLSQPLFKIVEVSQNLTIEGDSNKQYWAEGSINLTPHISSGYECVGSSGFSVTGQNSTYKPYMMSVFKAAIRQDNNGIFWFDYGLTNTGVNQQKVTLKFYILEALTKEAN